MTGLNLSLRVVAAAALFIIAGDAWAHSMWLAPKGDVLEIQYGHENDLDPYKPERVGDVRAFAANGGERKVQLRGAGNIVAIDAPGAALVSATYDNKVWTKSASKGWVNLPRAEVPDGSQSGLSQKFTKAYLAPMRDFARPLGQPLELVPLTDPAGMKADEKLKIRVLLEGKPLVGVKVAANMFDYSDKAEKLVTDAEGVVTITIPPRQMAGVEVEYFAKAPDGSRIDGTWYTSSVTFRVAR